MAFVWVVGIRLLITILLVPRTGFKKCIKYSALRCLVKTCPICKNIFLHKNRGRKKYCSTLCAFEAKKEGKNEVKTLTHDKNCVICGKRFLPEHGNQKYCNSYCAYEGKRRKMIPINQKMIRKRDPLEHANQMRKLYHQNKLNKSKIPLGTYKLPSTPIKKEKNGLIEPDWVKEQQNLENAFKKLKLKRTY